MTTAILRSDLVHRYDPSNARLVLLTPLSVDLGEPLEPLHETRGVSVTEDGTTAVRVPAGFDSDGSSIPVVGQLVMGDRARYQVAGVVHDWLYRQGAPRGASDRAWWIVARSGELQVGPVRGLLGWSALRLFGWLAWRRRQR